MNPDNAQRYSDVIKMKSGKEMFKEKNNFGSNAPVDIKIAYVLTVIKTLWYQHKVKRKNPL